MAIAFGSAGARTNITVAGTAWSLAYPSGIAAGDLLVLHIVTSGGNVTMSSLTGWTEVHREATVTNPRGGLLIKVADGTETGSLSFTTTSTTGNAIMFRYTGVDPTTPLDVAKSSVSNTATVTDIVLPSITTVSANTMLIYADGANSGSTRSSSVTGTERVDHGFEGGKAGALYDEPVAAIGATGTRTIVLEAARANWGVMIALRPYVATNTHTEQITTFEDGTSGPWTSSVAGAGSTAVSTSDKHDGQYGISANVPAATVDKAGFTQTFTGAQQVTVSGWWKVTTEGGSGSNVPFARLFSGSQRLADVYRQNVSAGANVWLRVVKAIGGANYYFISTGYRLELNTWVYISFSWDLNGDPYVWIDGTQVLGPINKAADWFAATSIDTAYLGTHEQGNAGAWSMDTVTLSTNSIAQGINQPLAAEGLFSGSGTLTASVVPNPQVNAPYGGTGTLSSTRVANFSSSASLSGSGTLTNGVAVSATRSAALSGSGTLTGTGAPAVTVNGSLSGSGTVAASQDAMTVGIPTPLSGTGTLSPAVVAGFTASMSSSGVGTLGLSVGSISMQALGALTGSGTLSSTGTPAITKSVALSGSGTLTGSATKAASITANLSGDGALTASSSNSFSRAANLSGSGTLSGVITSIALSGSAALSGTGTLSAGGSTNKSVSVNLSGSGTLQVFTTSVGMTQSVGLSGSGTLSATAVVTRMAFPEFSGSGTLTATAKPDVMVEFNQASYGTMIVEFTTQRSVTAALSGVGLLIGAADDQKNYDVAGYLANNRWQGGLGPKRWEGKL